MIKISYINMSPSINSYIARGILMYVLGLSQNFTLHVFYPTVQIEKKVTRQITLQKKDTYSSL